MRGAIAFTRRVASTPADEWRHRLRQAHFTLRSWLAARAGRAPLGRRGAWRSLGVPREELRGWWLAREDRWFLQPERVAALTRRAGAPTFRRGVLDRADLVVDGRMPLFSHPPVGFDREDRWHRDPVLGRTAPRRFHARIRYLDVEQVGDSKYVWEPNRWAWALWLGLAYRTLGEARYAEKFVELGSDWFDKNPYPIGINYRSALEVGLRAYAWVWALHLFEDVLAHEASLLGDLLEGVWVACHHIEANLSTYFSPNTHLIGEAFCLLACGASLHEFRESERWRELGRDVLALEAERQFHLDGTHRELSSGYHLYCADFYLQACLIAEQVSCARDERILAAARKICERLAEMAPQDLVLPQFNDCDGGRVTSLSEEPLDAAPTLFAAASLWPDFAFDPREREPSGYALLMGREEVDSTSASEPTQRPGSGRSGLTPSPNDSGIATYRNAGGDYLLFRASPFGYRDCPHSHDAPLSFILHLGHEPLVVDSGVGSYTQDIDVRNAFRCARGKSVLLVDDEGPSEPCDWFTWKTRTDAVLATAGPTEDGYRCSGAHDGFSSGSRGQISVRREISLLDEGVVTVVDSWRAASPISVTSSLTLDPGVEIDLSENTLQMPSGRRVHFSCASPHGAIRSRRVPFSANYGSLSETNALICDLGRSTSGTFVTVLSRAGRRPPPAVPNGAGS